MNTAIVRGFIQTLHTDRRIRRGDIGAALFEQLYANTPDPWGLAASPFAQQRGLAVLDALAPFAPCGSLLDVGCGEGYFTRLFAGMSQRLTGIDVSPSALARAARRVPAARFICAGLHDYTPDEPFDVVTAIEMLYYVRPVDQALHRLLELGRTVIVSYATKHQRDVASIIEGHPRLDALPFCPFFHTRRFGFTIARFRGLTEAESSTCPSRPSAARTACTQGSAGDAALLLPR